MSLELNIATKDLQETIKGIVENNTRTQVGSGFDSATLSNCKLLNDKVYFVSNQTRTQESVTATDAYVRGATGWGQRLDSTFTDQMDTIDYIDIYVEAKVGSPPDLILTVYDETAAAALANITLPVTEITAGAFNRFAPTSPIAITRGNIIQIRLDANGLGDASNKCSLGYASNVQGNATLIGTTDLWSSKTNYTDSDLAYKINYSTTNTSGTVTLDISPTDAYEYGNIWFKKIIPVTPGTQTVALAVKDTNDNVLIADVADGESLASIDTRDYKTLRLVWTITRALVSDDTPELHPPHWTWLGGSA